jgi:glycosyltransferase involved in cell wall biosynthesis
MAAKDASVVSVVIPCFNGAAFVLHALQSTEAQGVRCQVIVIDDGSTDESVTIIDDWASSHPGTVVRHIPNGGVVKATNLGISLAECPFLTLLDADDVLAAGVLDRHVALLDDRQDVGVVYGQVTSVSADLGEHLGDYVHGAACEGDILLELIEHGSVVPLVGTVIRTDLVRELGELDPDAYYQDWPLWLGLARRTSFAYSDQVAGLYRRHEATMSSTRSEQMALGRMRTLRRLYVELDGELERRAVVRRARWNAHVMWEGKFGSASTAACRQFLRIRPDGGLALITAAMWMGIPRRPIARVVRRINPDWWRIH